MFNYHTGKFLSILCSICFPLCHIKGKEGMQLLFTFSSHRIKGLSPEHFSSFEYRSRFDLLPSVSTQFIVLNFHFVLVSSKRIKMSQRFYFNEGHCNGLRKIRKPLMEKKRRARINDSLEKLKQILLKNTVAMTYGSRPTKLEKADILEMTVRYLQILQSQKSSTATLSNNDCVTSTTDLTKSHATVEKRPFATVTTNAFSAKVESENKENLCANFDVKREKREPTAKTSFKKSQSSAFKEINKNLLFEADPNVDNRPWRPW